MRKYLIDTSSLVRIEEPKLGLTTKQREDVWSAIEAMFESGQLRTVDIVYEELKRNRAAVEFESCYQRIKPFRRKRRSVFRKRDFPGHLAMPLLDDVVNDFPKLSGVFSVSQIEKADPYLIALARWERATLVTEESPAARNRIPAACIHYGVDCTNVRGLIAREQMI